MQALAASCEELRARTGKPPLLRPKSLSEFIISMTKLLDADWLRGVQLFH